MTTTIEQLEALTKRHQEELQELFSERFDTIGLSRTYKLVPSLREPKVKPTKVSELRDALLSYPPNMDVWVYDHSSNSNFPAALHEANGELYIEPDSLR